MHKYKSNEKEMGNKFVSFVDKYNYDYEIRLLDNYGNPIGKVVEPEIKERVGYKLRILDILKRIEKLPKCEEVRMMENKNYARIIDLIWLSFNEKGIHDEELGDLSLKEILNWYIDDLKKGETFQYTIYDVQLAADLLGARSMLVFAHPSQPLLRNYRLRLSQEQIKI